MDTVFKFIYYYILLMLVAFTLYLTTMLAISPKQDRLKRGFIPCTEQLVINVSECERGSISCPLKYLWHDLICNTNVILEGIGAWSRGQQSTPWANYLFEAQTEPQPIESVEEGLYSGNPADDIADIEKQRQFFNAKQKELEAAKNRNLNLNEDVIMSAPDETFPEDVEAIDMLPETVEEELQNNDFSDEDSLDDIIPSDSNLQEENTENEQKD